MTHVRSLDNSNNFYFYYHRLFVSKFGRVRTYLRWFSTQTLKSSPTSCFIAFAFNTKSFAIAFLVFFFVFFPSHHFFWTDCQKLFNKRFMISYQEGAWPRSVSFLGHTKKSFLKNCSSICYLWRVWYMARLMHGNQHSYYPKKHKKQRET